MRKELLFTAAALSATVFATTVFADGRFPGLQKNEVGGIETNIEETLPAELLNFFENTPRKCLYSHTSSRGHEATSYQDNHVRQLYRGDTLS